MAISTSSLKSLIDAFAVLTEKDSISPTTVATILYRLAGLLDEAASLNDVAAVRNSLTALSKALSDEKIRATNAEGLLTGKLNALRNTHDADKVELIKRDASLQIAINDLKDMLAREEARAKETYDFIMPPGIM